jgi:hypothetical protein
MSHDDCRLPRQPSSWLAGARSPRNVRRARCTQARGHRVRPRFPGWGSSSCTPPAAGSAPLRPRTRSARTATTASSSQWSDPVQPARNIAWTRELFDAIRPSSPPRSAPTTSKTERRCVSSRRAARTTSKPRAGGLNSHSPPEGFCAWWWLPAFRGRNRRPRACEGSPRWWLVGRIRRRSLRRAPPADPRG